MSVLYIKDKNGNFVPVPYIKTNGGAEPDWNAAEGETFSVDVSTTT